MSRSIRIEVAVEETTAPIGLAFAFRRFSASRPGSPAVFKDSADISARLDGLENGEYAVDVTDISVGGAPMGTSAKGSVTVGDATAPLTYQASKGLSVLVI